MANTMRIKRRASGGAGAPSSLANAELAFNEVDNILYYGKGTGGAGGTATTIEAIGGSGAYLTLTGTQTVTGAKTFSSTVDLGASAVATTPTSSDNSTKVATTAFVKAQGYGTGTVTSVSLSSLPAFMSATTPSNSEGAIGLGFTFSNQAAGFVLASPSGSTGAPSFRALVASDIPSLTSAKISDLATTVQAYRLDQFAAPTADVSFNSRKITGLSDPTNAQDAATKAYVDATKMGLDVKDSVRVATTANITLSGTQTIDGVSVIAGDRVLVKDQTTGSQNGIYVVAAGAWSRSADANVSSEVTGGMFTFVNEGTVNADSGWVLTTNDTITLDTTALTFTQFSGAGQITAGAGLTKTGNTLDVGTASASRIVVNADNIDLATTGVSASTYRSVTVDAYGRVTAGTNPTTLSGYGITDAQSLDATLTALAGVTTAADKLIYATGVDTFLTTDLTSTARTLLDDTSTGAMRTTLGLAIGTDVQAYDATLAALAGVTTAADKLIYATGSDTFATTDLTSFGRSLIDDADASTARTTLGLGSMATQASSNVTITGGSIDGITLDGGTF